MNIGLKLTTEHGESFLGFRWPDQAGVEVHPDLHTGEMTIGPACPTFPGDGLCIGLTLRGAQSRGKPCRWLTLVGWNDDDVLSDPDPDVVRVRKALTLSRRLDVWKLIRDGEMAGADLRDADLRDADLWGADLWGADLRSADLWGATLRDADLWGADLRGATLRDADLRDATLRGADLRGAILRGAILRGADLRGADLRLGTTHP